MIQNLLKKYGSLLGLLSNLTFVGAFLLALWGSLIAQFVLHELPCPLCVLQRYSMLLICLGLIYIIISRQKGELDYQKFTIAYGMSIINALLGLLFSGRQILLPIAPNDPGYGGAFLGFHFYTWSFITFLIAIIYCAIMLLCSKYFFPDYNKTNKLIDIISKIVLYVFLFTVLVIFIAIIVELGFNFKLPDDPVQYNLFN
ncbi:hypothetical protein BH746_11745 [Enterococcus faecalis]|uniref:disulfide bond formation protein B n=1 Tax=Enterococcus faecalis TaxID=1351 RepID=UPI0009C077A6|nr:disulfide bond formation protein B [Enterococcus faecalis]OQO72568.1 hypothetical protein BH746_11745 [Enterococcus faecalis]